MPATWIRPLAEADAECGAKAHGLARLMAAGLRVPDGFVITAEAFRTAAAIADAAPQAGPEATLDAIGHALAAAAERITRAALPEAIEREVVSRATALGRLAVRSSASIEDGALGSAAGVFASLTDVPPGEVWPAIRGVWTSALTPLAVAYARRRATAWIPEISVIVQRFVPGARATVYTRPIGAPDGSELWIEQDGRLDRVPRAAAGSRAEAVQALAAEAAVQGDAGVDVELVVNADSPPWIVQVRPMIHPAQRRRLAPPPIVVAGLVRDGRRWTWDIAHNPDPLSPAQAGLVEAVDRTAWSPVALRVCGGYLYTAPRERPAPPAPPADRAELALRIATIEPRLAALLQGEGEPAAVIARYVDFLQIWTCELSPLVAAARRALLDRLASLGHPREQIPALAATLIGPRRAPREPVMSPAWDVAVPTFAERPMPEPAAPAPRGRSATSAEAPELPIARATASEVELARAAADAAEHDDVWFARAQWMVRRMLQGRAHALGLHGDDIFWIPLDDAVTMRTLDPDEVHRRAAAARAAHARTAEWDMPIAVHGEIADPASAEPHEITLRGVGIGPRAVGRVVRFASLAAARPVARDEIVVTRAVTPALAMVVDGCAALVSETGGLLDHGAALARELGITCVVGCAGAWTQLGDGALISVDGDAGVVSAL